MGGEQGTAKVWCVRASQKSRPSEVHQLSPATCLAIGLTPSRDSHAKWGLPQGR